MLNTVTRWPNGFTNSQPGSALGDLKVPNPTTYFSLFDDFLKYTATDWSIVESDPSATEALASGPNGQLQITNSNGLGDYVNMKWSGGTGSPLYVFPLGGTKDTIFGVRFYTEEPLTSGISFSLTSSDGQNGFVLDKPGSSNDITASVVADNNAYDSDPVTLSDGYNEAVIVYTAEDGKATFYLNGAAYSMPFSAPSGLGTVGLTLSNVNAASHFVVIDWVLAAVAR